MKYFLLILRIAIGLLFIYSGVLKANDPMGLVYKMDEFFVALNMNFMIGYSFAFSVFMIALEIVCGVAVLIGFSFRLFSTLMLLLNVFFLFITAFALFSGKVKECGCFGTCVKISNNATFAKDIILTIISLILFIYRNRAERMFGRLTNQVIFFCAVLFAITMEWYTLTYLPVYDCMAFKIGNNIWQKMNIDSTYKPEVTKTILTYEKNGVKKEFTLDNYPWQDTTWKAVGTPKNIVISEAQNEPEIHDFVLNDSDKNNVTEAVMTAKGYTLFWFVRDIDKAHLDHLDRVQVIANKAASLHVPMYVLCSSNRESGEAFLKRSQLGNLPLLTLDGTASRTAMRTDPGVMLIHDGVVVNKWSYADYPKNLVMNGDKLEISK